MHNYFKICLGKAAIAIINLLLLGNVLLDFFQNCMMLDINSR